MGNEDAVTAMIKIAGCAGETTKMLPRQLNPWLSVTIMSVMAMICVSCAGQYWNTGISDEQYIAIARSARMLRHF